MYNLNLISYIITTLFTFYAFVGIILQYFKFYKVFDRLFPSLEHEFLLVMYICLTCISTFFTVFDGIIGIKAEDPNGSTLVAFILVGLFGTYITFISTWSVVDYLIRLRNKIPNR